MPSYFSVKGDTRKPAYFRVSIDMSAFDDAQSNDNVTSGAVTPTGNFPTSDRPYITNLSTLATSTTRATTQGAADARERGLMRFEKMVQNLQTDTLVDILDIEILEANGDAQATLLEFSISVESPDHINTTTTDGIPDGSTRALAGNVDTAGTNTQANRFRALIASGINGGTTNVDFSSTTTYKELRTRYLPLTGGTEMSEIEVGNPTAYGEIFDAIVVNQLTGTLAISGGDDSTQILKTSQN
jgi:hypothetical protein|tara:strand:+ start:613 stop:1341 length:729 start_codon:yes stop_codon:yes gene_type:complete